MGSSWTSTSSLGVPRWQLGTVEQAGLGDVYCRPLRPSILLLVVRQHYPLPLDELMVCDLLMCDNCILLVI